MRDRVTGEADEARRAARKVVDQCVSMRHECCVTSCQHVNHRRDVAYARYILDMLGINGDAGECEEKEGDMLMEKSTA